MKHSLIFGPTQEISMNASVSSNGLNKSLKGYKTLRLFYTVTDLIFFFSFGLDGKNCVLRAICEKTEFYLLPDGIVDEVISLLLEYDTYSYTYFR